MIENRHHHNHFYKQCEGERPPRREVKYYFRHIIMTRDIVFEDGFEIHKGEMFETENLVVNKNLIKLSVMVEGKTKKGKFEKFYDITGAFEYVNKENEKVLDFINTRMEVMLDEMNRVLGEYKMELKEIKRLLNKDVEENPGTEDKPDTPPVVDPDQPGTTDPEPTTPPENNSGNEEGKENDPGTTDQGEV